MSRKPVVLTFACVLLGSSVLPLEAGQIPGMQMQAVSQTDKTQKSVDTQMMNHQAEMKDLIVKLNASFQAIVDAKDAKGYVKDKSLVKAHEADLTALRNAVRAHKLFLTAEEQACGAKSKDDDAMIQHQQQMKSVLYDAVDTFSTYQSANDSSIEASEPVEDALAAHRSALAALTDASAQHQQAMAQMMKRCS